MQPFRCPFLHSGWVGSPPKEDLLSDIPKTEDKAFVQRALVPSKGKATSIVYIELDCVLNH
jgi:hypothetical protein